MNALKECLKQLVTVVLKYFNKEVIKTKLLLENITRTFYLPKLLLDTVLKLGTGIV